MPVKELTEHRPKYPGIFSYPFRKLSLPFVPLILIDSAWVRLRFRTRFVFFAVLLPWKFHCWCGDELASDPNDPQPRRLKKSGLLTLSRIVEFRENNPKNSHSIGLGREWCAGARRIRKVDFADGKSPSRRFSWFWHFIPISVFWFVIVLGALAGSLESLKSRKNALKGESSIFVHSGFFSEFGISLESRPFVHCGASTAIRTAEICFRILNILWTSQSIRECFRTKPLSFLDLAPPHVWAPLPSSAPELRFWTPVLHSSSAPLVQLCSSAWAPLLKIFRTSGQNLVIVFTQMQASRKLKAGLKPDSRSGCLKVDPELHNSIAELHKNVEFREEWIFN